MTAGVEARAQSYGLEWEDSGSWNLEQWERFADEQGIPCNEITPDEYFDNVINDHEEIRNSNCPSCELDSYGGLLDLQFNVGDVSVLAQDLDKDGVLDYKYITNNDGDILYNGSILNDSDDSLTENEDFQSWYQQNFGTDVPEEISDEVLFDYYEDLITAQENSITGSDTGIDSGLTEAEKIALSASLAASLNSKIQSIYGTSSLPMPPVLYNPNKTGYASFDNGVIYTTNAFFNLLTIEGDRMSCLLHEYTHYVHFIQGINNPIKDDNGKIVNIKTGEVPSRTPEEYNEEYNARYLQNKALEPDDNDNDIILQTNAEMQMTYTYVCSNLYKDELAARKAEVKGEKDGLFVMSDSYRHKLSTAIPLYEIKVARALKYESLNNLKPNGSPK